MNGCDQHFVPVDERIRQSPRFSRKSSGRSSPAHSAYGSGLLRQSIMNASENKRAKKVRFYRNGDRFFGGMIFAVSPERFRTFESLLTDLTASPHFGDKSILPNGVRHIFTIDGSTKITNLSQLEEDESYVCASVDIFRNVGYGKAETRNWIPSSVKHIDPVEGDDSRQSEWYENKDFIKPRLITIIRNSGKPRKAVRILLNRKTAHSFNQVIDDITDAIKLDSGVVKKLYTVSGKQVTTLQDFFKDDTIFIAYGYERLSNDDFCLDENEVRLVNAYKFSQATERITLKSPKSQRKLSPLVSNGGPNKCVSPRTVRRSQVKNVISQKSNGLIDFSTPEYIQGKYDIGQLIGQGNFALVKECTERKSGLLYALKIINKQLCKDREDKIANEVEILREMMHPNIIQLIEEFDTHDSLYLVMELVQGGDLFDAINSATKYTEQDASLMTRDLASALKYLHSRNIIHRDVKPENLLVVFKEAGNLSLKLGDFGLATYAVSPLYVVCGTPTYVAPEILNETGYNKEVDVWAAGIIVYVLLCGYPPFVSASGEHSELFMKIMDGHFEFQSPFWDSISGSAKELISRMLAIDADSRYTASDILLHPWVADDAANDIDMQTVVSKELNAHFQRHERSSTEPGIKLITSTALDKGSRYFAGPRGTQLSIQDDTFEEVF